MLRKLKRSKSKLAQKAKSKIRAKAIEKTKVRLVLSGVKIEDFSEEELEVIIKDEEEKLLSGLKTKSTISLLALVGMDVI